MNALIDEAWSSRRAPDAALDLNDVALFVQVTQAASFSAAAKAHGVPVSTVSRRIARLEASLGTRLLERTTRKFRLTDVGRTYLAHAERALDELAQGSHQVRELHMVPRGRVRITAPVGLGPRLTSALASYMAETPLVSIEIDLTERRVDLLAEGFDIALRGGHVDSADFVARKITDATRHLFASKAYLDRRGRPKRVADLSSHDLIATRSSTSGAVWELFSSGGSEGNRNGGGDRRYRFAFKPRLFVNELSAARNAALSGIGIALLPSPVADSGQLEHVLPNMSGEGGGLWVLYPARRSLTAAVRSCVEHLLVSLRVDACGATTTLVGEGYDRGRRGAKSQAVADLPIGARGGPRHHRGTAKE
jgi:DNA-binding transcriptional LysR family regulator